MGKKKKEKSKKKKDHKKKSHRKRTPSESSSASTSSGSSDSDTKAQKVSSAQQSVTISMKNWSLSQKSESLLVILFKF